jgi:hypothetical protein
MNTEIAQNARAQQYGHEVDTWLRTLAYLQQENIYLKNRVADLLRYDINDIFLEDMDCFQTMFLDKDAALSIMRHDVSELADKLDKRSDNGFKVNLIKEEQLRRDMEKMEAEFSRLKTDFNKYVFDVLLPATA